ncbi:MAG: hydrogenase iron-sulfur subunit [Pseudomonadota bacterium]
MGDFEPVILVFACSYCAYTAADMAGTQGFSYPAGVKIVQVPCSGKVDSLHIMRALQKGADGVMVAGCLEGDCHFHNGNRRASQRVRYVQAILDDVGIGGQRVLMANMSAGQGAVFAATASNFSETIRALGPNPVKEGATRAAA